MQNRQPSPQSPPPRGHKSQRRAIFAASLVLLLGMGARGLATGFAPLFPTEPAPVEAAMEGLLAGSAITFAERAQPWLDALGAASEADHRRISTDLSEVLLGAEAERSARAAVLLGSLLANEALPPGTRGAAQESLLYRLAQRIDTGARWSVGPDVTAARALDREYGSPALQASVREMLTELAYGAVPHPSLAVRVECAATFLKLSASLPPTTSPVSVEATTFLLAVLRAETPAQVESPRTWPRITTLAWVKTRSAEALARWTGTKNRFRPDGSWAHQVAEAARFESLLR